VSRVPVVVLGSGRGSNFDAVASAIELQEIDAQILGVVSDRPGAGILEKAKSRGISAFSVPSHPGEDRRQHENRIWEILQELKPRFLILAGYMRVLTADFLNHFYDSKTGYYRVVNIHPSLLPAFPGVRSYAQAFQYGCKWTGVTVHLVSPEVDGGPICAQEGFSIEDCESIDQVEKRGLKVEHRLFSQTLKWVIQEEFKIDSLGTQGRFRVCPT